MPKSVEAIPTNSVENEKPVAAAEKKPRQRRQRNERQKRRDSSASDGKHDQSKKAQSKAARNSPREAQPDSNLVLVGRKPIGAYVGVLKTLLATKFDECELQGVMPQTGNSKVIWIANRMVEWGYCAMTRVRTVAPAQLCITLKKATDFNKVNEAFAAAQAEKQELRRRAREQQAKEKAAEREAAKTSETD